MTDGTGYRIERLRARLALGDLAELGLRIEARADTVTISGIVADVECREIIRRAAAEELAGLTLHLDLAITAPEAPTQAEQL